MLYNDKDELKRTMKRLTREAEKRERDEWAADIMAGAVFFILIAIIILVLLAW